MVVGDEADYCCDVDESKERKIREIELSQKGVFFFWMNGGCYRLFLEVGAGGQENGRSSFSLVVLSGCSPCSLFCPPTIMVLGVVFL